MPRLIRPDRLAAELEDGRGPTVLDIRKMAASNGWPSRQGVPGGRIPGAVPFPAPWLDDPSSAEVLERLADPCGALVSVRSWAEFIGEVSGYHYVKPKGRIPGAVFGNCGSDAYHMQNYRNHDNTMRDFRRIEAGWREVGVTAEKRVAFYCGTGWRGSEAFMCAWLMGWPRIAVYDGGWFDWSIDEERPLATGVPENVPRAFA